MPMPRSVKIDGKDIDEVQGVNITINTPVGPRGDYEGRTHAATVQLMRRARNTPTMEMFKAATNEDGRLNIISGEIVLQNSQLMPTYTLTMDECYVSEWSFTQPSEDDMLYEVIILKAGKIKLAGGGGSKDFKVPEFNKKPS
jgi:hypothetical protein